MNLPTGLGMFPQSLQASTSAYLDILDTKVPGLINAVYAVGSVALGDYQQRTSNLDLVVVTDHSLPTAALHDAVKAQKKLDRHRGRPAIVAYPTTADLARDPRHLDVPCFEGSHRIPSDRLVNPMTWQMLTNSSTCLRGPERASTPCDSEAIKMWAAGQLKTVWQPGLAHPWLHISLWFRRNVSATVLELARLSVIAATGAATSKTDAAMAIRAQIPGHFQRCLDDAVDYRSTGGMSTSMYWGPWERKRDVTALLREIVRLAPDGSSLDTNQPVNALSTSKSPPPGFSPPVADL